MQKMAETLKEQGFIVHNIGYPSCRYNIETLAKDYLHPVLQTLPLANISKLHFVGHSLGSILVRYYANQHSLANLGRLVMIAPPNNGSELAEFLRKRFLYKWIYGPAGQQLGTGSNDFLAKLSHYPGEFAVIAGDQNCNPLFRLIVPSPSDGKVSVRNTKLAGMNDFLQVHCAHAGIIQDATVMRQTAHFLQHGAFDKA
jgi:pimeloyl-ACP methyl ester carboxylesterase